MGPDEPDSDADSDASRSLPGDKSDGVLEPSAEGAENEDGGQLDPDIEQLVFLSRQRRRKTNQEIVKTKLESDFIDQAAEIPADPVPAIKPVEPVEERSADDLEHLIYLSRKRRREENPQLGKTRLEGSLADEFAGERLLDESAPAPLAPTAELPAAELPDDGSPGAEESDSEFIQDKSQQVTEVDPDVEQLVYLSRQKRKNEKPELAKTRLDTDALRDVASKTAEQHADKLRKQIAEQAALPAKELKPVSKFSKASPCSSSWGSLDGEGDMRFCQKCQLMVYNLDTVEQEEAEQIVCQREGLEGVVLFRREDGKFLSRNCPVGAARQRITAAFVVFGVLFVAAGSFFLVTQSARHLVKSAAGADRARDASRHFSGEGGTSPAAAAQDPEVAAAIVPEDPRDSGEDGGESDGESGGPGASLVPADAKSLAGYARQLRNFIQGSYTPPGTIEKSDSKVIVQLRISQSGAPIGFQLIQTSGYPDIDRYVVKSAVAGAYPAPPFSVGKCLLASVTFDRGEVSVAIP